MTAEVETYRCDEAEARALTDAIKATAVKGNQQIKQAMVQQAWAALGHANWDDYCLAEFGTLVRLPRNEREAVIAAFRDDGKSLRAIGAAIGDSPRTIRRDLAGGANATPEPVHSTLPGVQNRSPDPLIAAEPPLGQADCEALEAAPVPRIKGRDGKSYPAAKPKPTATDLDTAERTLTAAVEARVPGAATDLARTALRARWSRLISATAEISTMNAEAVAAVLDDRTLAAARLTARSLTKFVADIDSHRTPTLRAVGGTHD